MDTRIGISLFFVVTNTMGVVAGLVWGLWFVYIPNAIGAIMNAYNIYRIMRYE